MTAFIRRIVTGIDREGRSCIVEDGRSPAERTVEARPGYRVTNLWCTARGAALDADDAIAGHQGVQPPAGGTILRVIDVPPEAADEQARRAAVEATFRSMFPDAHRDGTVNAAAHPGMHQTPTVDYAIVLEGELTAILEADETVMHAGDVLIQRGTQHAWANRSGRPARIAFILVDPS
ncbi:cupin domain-containing protein [Verticiella sediminum]|uniref:Cupin domain-containing protein n=1 Tax=Verticiella sediminum TaxID=1247510 RepID=A0A556AGQ5_9BURK|nr:cupin domain-containing protein [Verticiella sediminum]TSH92043.1 cupin domain-containing protein [Verticiella sediminum]